VLVRALRRFLAAGTEPTDIAIVTGYSAQQALLVRTMRSELGAVAEGIRVDTVDGFQGAERDLVLVSTVRANLSGEVGFMRDPRRVNVLLTRARRGLVVFGDSATLDGDAGNWRPWLRWVRERGAVVSVGALAAAGDTLEDRPAQAGRLPLEQGACARHTRLVHDQYVQRQQPLLQREEWTPFIDPNTGRKWLYNEATGESVWEAPGWTHPGSNLAAECGVSVA